MKIARLSFRYMLQLLIAISLIAPLQNLEAKTPRLPTSENSSFGETISPLVIQFMNRQIFTIRSGIAGFTQEERAQSIVDRIKIAMEKGGGDHITFRPTQEEGRVVELNGFAVFQIRPVDLDPLLEQSIDEAAKQAASNLKIAVQESRQLNNVQEMTKGIGLTFVASLLFYLTIVFMCWFERTLVNYTQGWLQKRADRWNVVMHPQQLTEFIVFWVNNIKWIVVGVFGYQWATYCLSQFPYFRPFGEKLHHYLVDLMSSLLSAIVGAIPGLLVIALIIVLTRFTANLLKAFFLKIETQQLTLSWLAEDTARPTRKITQALLWLFAFAMAYPYFPGSNTDAFRGLSVLMGIMLSIGGSGVVGQAASGLIMIYSRVLREGEYVKSGEYEGLVTQVGFFSTKIKTSSGEEINLPNSIIGSSATINYSRLAKPGALVFQTSVTIGYNTPWRQVQAMLLQAANNTSGILKTPEPFVTQTALSDFYVEYVLCVQIEKPQVRRRTISALHANIQDVFNEFGVQIMSPHYLTDPAEKVWVPKEQWFRSTAEESNN